MGLAEKNPTYAHASMFRSTIQNVLRNKSFLSTESKHECLTVHWSWPVRKRVFVHWGKITLMLKIEQQLLIVIVNDKI